MSACVQARALEGLCMFDSTLPCNLVCCLVTIGRVALQSITRPLTHRLQQVVSPHYQ
jgi:hypothetical protein